VIQEWRGQPAVARSWEKSSTGIFDDDVTGTIAENRAPDNLVLLSRAHRRPQQCAGHHATGSLPRAVGVGNRHTNQTGDAPLAPLCPSFIVDSFSRDTKTLSRCTPCRCTRRLTRIGCYTRDAHSPSERSWNVARPDQPTRHGIRQRTDARRMLQPVCCLAARTIPTLTHSSSDRFLLHAASAGSPALSLSRDFTRLRVSLECMLSLSFFLSLSLSLSRASIPSCLALLSVLSWCAVLMSPRISKTSFNFCAFINYDIDRMYASTIEMRIERDERTDYAILYLTLQQVARSLPRAIISSN